MTAASTAESVGIGQLRVGEPLARTFRLMGRNFGTLMVVLLAPALAATAISWAPRLYGAGLEIPDQIGLAGLASVAVYLLPTPIAQVMMVHATAQSMRNRPLRIGEIFAAALPRTLPVMLIALMVSVLAGLASLLLIVPGVMVITALFVADPACVVERLTADASLSRSGELTKGQRWRICGIFLIAMLLHWTIGIVLALLLERMSTVPHFAVDIVWNAIVMAFSGILSTVIYFDLRALKEGVDVGRVAAVFD
jgi:hypothetical protein